MEKLIKHANGQWTLLSKGDEENPDLKALQNKVSKHPHFKSFTQENHPHYGPIVRGHFKPEHRATENENHDYVKYMPKDVDNHIDDNDHDGKGNYNSAIFIPPKRE